jgi:hypothetical protein
MSGRTVVGSNTTAAALQPSGNSTGIAWRVAVAVVVPVLVVALLAWLVRASALRCCCLSRLAVCSNQIVAADSQPLFNRGAPASVLSWLGSLTAASRVVLLLLGLWLQLTRAYARKAPRLPALIWQQRKLSILMSFPCLIPIDKCYVLISCFLLLQLTRAYSRKASRLPALIWQQRKRALGPPRSGRMSIVVTDIQGYSTLTNEAPDDMAQVTTGV